MRNAECIMRNGNPEAWQLSGLAAWQNNSSKFKVQSTYLRLGCSTQKSGAPAQAGAGTGNFRENT